MPNREKSGRKRRGIWLAAAAVVAIAFAGWMAFLRAKDDAIGRAALQDVQQIVALGPRPVGSEAHRQEVMNFLNALDDHDDVHHVYAAMK